MPHALIIEDDTNSLQALVELVQREGFTASGVATLAEARTELARQSPDVVLADVMLPDGSGMDFFRELDALPPAQVVVITGYASVDTAVTALRMGASDYLTKPIDISRLKAVLANVARAMDLQSEIDRLRAELRQLGRFGEFVGVSPAMQRLYEVATKVAPTSATILLTGESGTGKDLMAQTIHSLSKQRKGPFLPVNCGAISTHLIESELFGHERGSFTGADRTHKGYFERAYGGTLFLDEIVELPAELQVKLLRVLETSTLTRVGGEETVETDVRVVAATNRNPEEEVAKGRFREDLLYRLKVFSLQLPPLRERENDVILLADHFLSLLNKEAGTNKQLSAAAVERMRRHSWPGNVRELKNVIHHAFILAGDEITPQCLPDDVAQTAEGAQLHAGSPANESGPIVQLPVGTSIAEAERYLVLRTLDQCGGDKKKAAQALGISLKTLYNRLNAYKSGNVPADVEPSEGPG